ncbi:thioesterase [Streptomyces sp. JJ36]|nr:thioesterase [Streptomyces sp. JJ36]
MPHLLGETPGADDAFRLFCFPYAGGNAAVYRGLRATAGPGLAVYAVEPPGRGRRMAERPYDAMGPLVAHLADALAPALDRPYAFFGHSLGGLVAFELARVLRARGARQPEHLFVSASAAPGSRRVRPVIHSATPDAVKQELRTLGGTPPEVLENDEVMEVVMPMLRADYAVLETYRHDPGPPLGMPLTVFGGTTDPVAPADLLEGWRAQSVHGARIRMMSGGHFYLHDAAAPVMAAVEHTLGLRTGGLGHAAEQSTADRP